MVAKEQKQLLKGKNGGTYLLMNNGKKRYVHCRQGHRSRNTIVPDATITNDIQASSTQNSLPIAPAADIARAVHIAPAAPKVPGTPITPAVPIYGVVPIQEAGTSTTNREEEIIFTRTEVINLMRYLQRLYKHGKTIALPPR